MAHAAGSVARGLLGDQADAPDVATAAENWHNAYTAMPVERQRRFWVRFFMKVMNGKNDFLKGQVAHAAGQFAKGFLGDETASSDEVASPADESMEQSPRERRFWVRLFL